MTTLAGYTFFQYDVDQSWYVPIPSSRTNRTPVWGQTFYDGVVPQRWWDRYLDRLRRRAPSAVASGEGFSEPDGEPAPSVPGMKREKLEQDTFTLSEPHRMEFPDDLTPLLDVYFNLNPRRKQAFYAASHLWVQCIALRSKAPSLSLLAAASAVETLVRCDDPKLDSCKNCGAPKSIEKCEKCDAPIYRLKSNFRNFFVTFGDPGLWDYAGRLYDVRSGISHAGTLLRREFADDGFNKGGKDEQMLFGIYVPRRVRFVLVNWLLAQAGAQVDVAAEAELKPMTS